MCASRSGRHSAYRWLWPDVAIDGVSSHLEQEPQARSLLVAPFALAEVILCRAGERVGVPGLMRRPGSRQLLDKLGGGANATCTTFTQTAEPAADVSRLSARRDSS